MPLVHYIYVGTSTAHTDDGVIIGIDRRNTRRAVIWAYR